MLTDEDILEKDDLYILARMKEFVLSEDVAQVSASRSLLALIERVVGNTASCAPRLYCSLFILFDVSRAAKIW